MLQNMSELSGDDAFILSLIKHLKQIEIAIVIIGP